MKERQKERLRKRDKNEKEREREREGERESGRGRKRMGNTSRKTPVILHDHTIHCIEITAQTQTHKHKRTQENTLSLTHARE